MPRRRAVLVGLFLVVALLTAFLLREVLATVFFGVTVAYVLVPLYQWLRRRGLGGMWASATATLAAYLTAIALFLPIGAVLYLRRGELVALVTSLPETVEVGFGEFVYSLDTGQATDAVADYVTGLAIGLARATPELLAHATVFGFVVFGLLIGRHRIRRALLLPIPDAFHDIPHALHERIRGTLFALYVIQAATSLGTFVVATALFWLLGYPSPIVLGVMAGLLQFLPVVGPSLLVVGIAAYEVSIGAIPDAVAVLVLGLILIGLLPDAVLRPRLARETAELPASLYFVGFTGGLLSLGPVGVIAGPLAVALLSESIALLAQEASPLDAASDENVEDGSAGTIE